MQYLTVLTDVGLTAATCLISARSLGGRRPHDQTTLILNERPRLLKELAKVISFDTIRATVGNRGRKHVAATLYFEDIDVPSLHVSTGRTVTDADAGMFCMISGDWNPLHCDEEFARTTRFGRRVVGGIFGITLLTGMFTRWGIFELSAVAMLSIDKWEFLAPIFIGDTLHAEMHITGKRLTSKGDYGIITRDFALINQDKTIVQRGSSPMMIARRPEPQTVAV